MFKIYDFEIHKYVEEMITINDVNLLGPFFEELRECCIERHLDYPLTHVKSLKDGEYSICLTWDIEGISEDIYAIRKGMREVSYQVIHSDFLDTFQEYLDEEFPTFIDEGLAEIRPQSTFTFKKFEWENTLPDGEDQMVPIVIYRDKRIEPVIDFINNDIKEDKVKDFCLGLILNYSDADMGRYTKNVLKSTTVRYK